MRVELNYNLDDVKVGFDPLPAATYSVIINDEPQIKSKEVDKELRYTLYIKFTVLEAENEEYLGRKLMHFCSVGKDFAGYPCGLKDTFLALGTAWDEGGFDTMDLLGLSCRVDVIQEFQKKKDPDTGEEYTDMEAPPRNTIKRIYAI